MKTRTGHPSMCVQRSRLSEVVPLGTGARMAQLVIENKSICAGTADAGLFSNVTTFSHTDTAHLVGFCGHVLYAGRVNPAIVEVEETAHGDGVVDGLLGPSGALDFVNIGPANLVRCAIDLIQEGEERFLRIIQG
jgi:hypothetical protein